MAKDSETVLEGFQEGPLKFPPTYKFDTGTNTYDTRLVVPRVLLWILGHWPDITESGSVLLSCLKGPHSPGGSMKVPFIFFPPCADFKQDGSLYLSSPSLSFNLPHPVGRSVNQLGPTESCGAWEQPRLQAQRSAQGSVAPCRGWPAGSKSRSTTTAVTWNTPSVTTNQSPPSLPCRWDTSGYTVNVI